MIVAFRFADGERVLDDYSLKLLNSFFSRKSIRKFSLELVEDVDVKKIIEAGQRAPSACNLQTYSIVWVKNTRLKEKVWDACGVSGSVRDAPVVFVICADVRRLARILDYLGHDHCLKHGFGYSLKLMSIVDACLVAENMTMATECLGLGSVYIGSALANHEVIKALGLPNGVLPLTLLCVGHPDEEPPTRPRWFLSSVLHVDHYQDPREHEVEAFLKHMDQELENEGYYQKYAKQRSTYHYSNHIKRKTEVEQTRKVDAEIVSVLERTGFLPIKVIYHKHEKPL